jgi:DNA recombination protein RmuC
VTDTIVILILVLVILFVLILLLFQIRTSSRLRALSRDPAQALRDEMSLQNSRALSHFNEQLSGHSLLFTEQIAELRREIQLASGQVGQRVDQASRLVGEVQLNLGALQQATERVFEIGKNIASLQEILKSPKLRGSLGELLLAELLAQILPSASYTLQHPFKSGDRVDAFIRLGEGGVPIDSKFPLENFKRMAEPGLSDAERDLYRKRFTLDVRKHIDRISSKYIVPDEGTLDFALMYIPAENIYYETIIKAEGSGDDKPISDYALEKKVVPVSPNTLYSYLRAILLGMKGAQVDQSARQMVAYLSRLRIDFLKFREEYEIVGKHLNNARLKYEESSRLSERFADKLNEFEIPIVSGRTQGQSQNREARNDRKEDTESEEQTR